MGYLMLNCDRDNIAQSDQDDFDPMEFDEGDWELEDTRAFTEKQLRERAQVPYQDDGFFNSQLTVSANTYRAFVLRGNKMGVFLTGAKVQNSRQSLTSRTHPVMIDPLSHQVYCSTNKIHQCWFWILRTRQR